MEDFMEPIDVAEEILKRLLAEIATYNTTIESEQDTRLKIVNRLFTEVLGWPLASVITEERSGLGFLDYKFSIDNAARLIVEAKKETRDLGVLNRDIGRAYKLSGPVFQSKDAQEGIEQAIAYCGRKNAELACVTNGHEWIVFRGSRIGDGRDTTDGYAFVFPTLQSVLTKFRLFYELLSFEEVARFTYQSLFQEAEGKPARRQLFRKVVRIPSSRILLPRDKLARDVDRLMTSFFRRLSGDADRDMLKHCFTATKESLLAEENLARISEDLVGRIRTLETESAELLTELIRRAQEMQRNEFIIIVGTKGAGKTTFIDRFFELVLPPSVAKHCTIIRVNLSSSDGVCLTVVSWLNRELLKAVEHAMFVDSPPTDDELQGMFFDEYKRWMIGTHKVLYETDKTQFKIEFGKHVEVLREQHPLEYICRAIGSIVRLRKKLPCVVFDNADHFDIAFQEQVFQYARSIYEREVCLIIVPVTDKTSWALSQQGALQSYENESLFLPVPPVGDVMQKRIDYVAQKADKESGEGYFFGRGITLSLKNLTAFADCLRAVFLKKEKTADWISRLANEDVRRSLELAESIMTSPHIQVESHVNSYILKQEPRVAEDQIKKAIICGKYDIYPVDQHKFVQNIYDLERETETSPLLGLRILQMLHDLHSSPGDGSRMFTPIEEILRYFSKMTFPAHVVSAWLDVMLKTGLCLSYDPTIVDIGKVQKVELSTSGLQHLLWGTGDSVYAYSMLQVTPILSAVAFEDISAFSAKGESGFAIQAIPKFMRYLIEEDGFYCNVPNTSAYKNQKRLGQIVSTLNGALDASPLFPATAEPATT
jgi:energy-coupling factor transporter ATP-binding protein EcfA2